MESGPPLNLSTSVKVEDSVIKSSNNQSSEGSASIKGELIQQADGDKSFVLLQPLTNNDNEVLTITGEAVKDTSAPQQGEDNLKEALNEDEQHQHNEAKTYKCSYCAEKFHRASQLRLHEKTHVEEKIHYCEQCLETFPRLSLLLRHKQEHTKKTYECPECDIPLSNYNGFRLHMKKHKGGKRFKCTECNMSFVQQSHLITHRRKHTGEKPYACHICNNHFKQVSHLTTHLRTHTKDRPYVCEFCSASFSQTGSLKRHRRSHTGEKPYQCEKCDSVFVEKRNLNRHLLSHSGIRPHKCDMCSASFTQYIDLQRHTFSHSGFKPYKCNVCEAAFSRKNNLKWHKLTHEGDTPHKCEICNVGFRIGRDLKNHKKYHMENKPYSCEHCNASFLQLNTLKRHVNAHTGNKSYVCDICKASFLEKSSLKRHIQRHDAAKPFPCNHCTTSFWDVRTLKRHKIVVHKQGKYEDSEVKSTEYPPKQNSIKEISPVLEEENSLHIYEPSYPKVTSGTEANMLLPPTIPDVPRETSEIHVQSGPVAQVVMSEPSSDAVAPIPTLVLSQPGQPPKTARPADNCQNHHSHVHTLLEGGYGQWQTWCFCDAPNIPSDSDPLSLPIAESQPVNIHENTQAILQQHQNLNYQEMSHSNPNVTQSLQTSLTQHQPHPHSILNQQQQEQHQHIENSSKPHQPITQAVYHVNTTSHSNEIQSVNVSYPHYNHINDYNNDITIVHSSQSVTEAADASLHANPTNQEERDLPPLIQKTTFMPINENTSFDPAAYQFTQGFKKPGQDKVKLKSVDSLSLLEKAVSATRVVHQSLECSDFSHQIVVNETVNEDGSSKSSNLIKEEADRFRTTHLVSSVEQQEPCYQESSEARQDYDCEKSSKLIEVSEQSVLVAKGEEQSHVQVSTQSSVSTPQQVVINTTHHNKDIGSIPPYQLSVYEELPQPVTHELRKEPVTLQYSMTVNNPATGAIQIQSDMFPAKTEETLPKRPIKKRRLPKNDNESKASFVCTVCSKTFTKKNQLDLHQRKHTGEKPFVCGICNQCFLHNNSLIIHMRSHTGERPFTCSYCGATFTQKSNLGVHHRVHTGEKPFKCDVCDTAFSQGSHLIAHKRIHNNDRPFVCSTCGQAFTQKSALKRHEIKHSGLKPHACVICGTKFSQKDDLKRHTAIHNNWSAKGKEKLTVSGRSLKAIYKQYGDKNSKKRAPKVSEKEGEDGKEGSNNELENKKDSLTDKAPKKELPEKMPIKKSIKRNPLNKAMKLKRKDLPEPVRTSKRIKEAAEKKKLKTQDSDFITGDLEEIDRVEEIEDELIRVAHTAGWHKKESQKTDSGEVVQSWCFCEVPHGPDEPHTHTDNSKFESEYPDNHSGPHLQQEIIPNVFISSENCREGVLQFTIPQLSHAVVLKSDQVALHPQQSAPENGTSTLNSENIVNPSVISEPQVLTPNINPTESSSVANHFLPTSDQIVTSQDIHTNPVIQDDGKTVYGTTQIISAGQVLPASHFVTSEGAFLIEASDIINNGAVVLNTSPGTFFFDFSGEGQLFNVPISTSVGHDPVIVAGSSSLEATGNPTSTSNQTIYSTSCEPTTTNTISFSVRDSHQNALIENSSHSSSVLASPDVASQPLLNSGPPPITNAAVQIPTATIPEAPAVQYTHIDGDNIGLFNANMAIDSEAGTLSSTTNSPALPALKETTAVTQESKIQPIIVTPSKCSVCGREFAGKGSLKQHLRTTHPGLHFCTICFDAFTTKEHLITHKLQHKSSHSCPECFLHFSNRLTLNQHRHKVHKVMGLTLAKKGNRNFECNRCKATFSQISDLNRHLLGHTGEKPFKCKQCGACFTRKSSLNKHERIHTGEKPYSCRECGLSFAYRYQINRHRSTGVHKEDQSNFAIPYVLN